MLSASTKVSQLEAYFSCPMKHWLRYGLRLEPPDTGELRPLDVGSVLHAVAERYVPLLDSLPPEVAAPRLTAEVLAESVKGSLDVNRGMAEVLAREATGMCSAIRTQLKAGSFRPLAMEKEFGFAGSDLEGVTLDVCGKKVVLRGKIDRIDVSGDLVRVIDYKTGSVKFSLTDLHSGIKLQLPVYLAVMLKAGYRPAGAFYFSTLSDFGMTDPHMLTGICSNDDEVLAAMDPHIAEGESGVVRVKRRGRKSYVCSGETGEDVRMLADYALRVSAIAAREISEGYIAPSPSSSGTARARPASSRTCAVTRATPARHSPPFCTRKKARRRPDMEWTPEQRRIIDYGKGDLLVSASAAAVRPPSCWAGSCASSRRGSACATCSSPPSPCPPPTICAASWHASCAKRSRSSPRSKAGRMTERRRKSVAATRWTTCQTRTYAPCTSIVRNSSENISTSRGTTPHSR